MADPGEPPAWMDTMVALADRFTVVGMDRRNAGNSVGNVAAAHGWRTYGAERRLDGSKVRVASARRIELVPAAVRRPPLQARAFVAG